jgi:hypothetical protein
MMDEKTLKDLIQEMELRAAEFEHSRNLYNYETYQYHYWDGKRSEAAFMVEKLTAILQGESQ